MALNGTQSSTKNFGTGSLKLTMEWSVVSQDAATLTNTVNCTFSVTPSHDMVVTGYTTFKLGEEMFHHIGTNATTANDYKWELTKDVTTVIYSTNLEILQTRSIGGLVQAGNLLWEFYYQDVTVTRDSGETVKYTYNKDYISRSSPNASIKLDKIVRTAYLTSAVNGATSITDEDALTINYVNPTGSTATSLQAAISISSGRTMEIPYRDIDKTGSSYTFSLTQAEWAAIYAKTLDKKIESCTVRFYIKSTVPEVREFESETEEAYIEVAMQFINFKPTINVTLVDTNLNSLGVTKDSKIFVRGISDVKFNLNSQVRKGATIKNQWIQNGENLLNVQSGYLTEVTNDTFYAYLEDNRGYFASDEIVIGQGAWSDYRWIEYFPLTCKTTLGAMNAYGQVDVTISGKFFEGSFGGTSNNMRMEYHILNEDTAQESYSPVTSITPTVDSEGNYKYTFTLTGLNYANRYSVTVLVIDAVMTATHTASLISAVPVFDWSKNDFEFHVPVTINGAAVPSIVEEGLTDIWTYRKWSNGIAECWGVKQLNSINISNSSSSGWYASGNLADTNITFPLTFRERPSVTVSTMPTGTSWAIVFPGSTAGDTTQTGSFQLLGTSSTTGKTYLLSYQVRGRWQ